MACRNSIVSDGSAFDAISHGTYNPNELTSEINGKLANDIAGTGLHWKGFGTRSTSTDPSAEWGANRMPNELTDNLGVPDSYDRSG